MFVKVCREHGPLERFEVVKSGFSRVGTQQYKCKRCVRTIKQRNYDKNRKKIQARHRRNRNLRRNKDE